MITPPGFSAGVDVRARIPLRDLMLNRSVWFWPDRLHHAGVMRGVYEGGNIRHVERFVQHAVSAKT